MVPVDSSEPTILEVTDVSKKFCRQLHRSLRYGVADLCREAMGGEAKMSLRPGEFFALSNINLTMRRGDSLALWGKNGAGKSTLLKMLNGLIKPTQGTIRIRGRIAALTTLGAGFNPVLSGRENAYINAEVLGYPKEELDARFDEMVAFAEIEHAIDDPVRTYSSGMKGRLGYAIGTVLQPDLLIMDEVLATGDRAFRKKCFAHLKGLTETGTSLIIVSHNVGQILDICNRGVVIDDGKLVMDGSSREGLAKYYEVLGIPKKTRKKKERSKTQAAPSPCPVRIESVSLLDSQDQKVEIVDGNMPVRLVIKLASDEAHDGTRVLVLLESNAGVISKMKTRGEGLKIPEGGKTLELQVKERSLKGSFRFVVRLKAAFNSTIYDQVDIPIQFGKRAAGGIVKINHSWEAPSTPIDT